MVLAVLCTAVCPALKQADSLQAGGPAPGSTIEPTLPVAIDLRLLSIAGSGSGGTARLAVVVTPDAAIPEFSLDVLLPSGLRVQDGTPLRGLSASLEAGVPRRYEAPLLADRDGLFPIRAEIAFRLADGRAFRAGQGVTLRLGASQPAGRLAAGAYEVPAVPLEALPR